MVNDCGFPALFSRLVDYQSLLNALRMEALLLVIMLLFGVLLLPVAIYVIGSAIFGAYAGQGFGDFYSSLHADLRGGKAVVLFLMLSPYIVWQLVRFSFRLFFSLSPRRGGQIGN